MTDMDDVDDDDLAKITEWPVGTKQDCIDLLEFVISLWTFPESCVDRPDDSSFHLSTGGWSDNEVLIVALMENSMFWIMCWDQSRRGGHYQFSVDRAP